MTLMDAARNAVALAKPKKSENLLVVTDAPSAQIGIAIYAAAAERCKASLLAIKPTGGHGREPPRAVAKAMRDADIIFCPTKYSLTHTEASRAAKRAGATVVTLPGITKDVFIRGMAADYGKIKKETRRLGKALRQAKAVRIVSSGTDITLDVRGCKDADDDADLHRKSIHNLPSGEAAIAPRDANGHFTAEDLHLTKRRVRIDVAGRKAVAVSSPKLRKHLWSVKNARNVAELGIGTNPGARLTDNVLEAEKVLGTCHIALGDSKSMGGSVRAALHWDFIIEKPTIWFDNRMIMERGRML